LSKPAETAGEPVSGLVAATRAELEAADRLGSAFGQAALALAVRVESGRDTGAAVAALTRELRASLDAALANARAAGSPLDAAKDELARRRALRGA
jgi:hypothetical protein